MKTGCEKSIDIDTSLYQKYVFVFRDLGAYSFNLIWISGNMLLLQIISEKLNYYYCKLFLISDI